jgi:hypothetical protein
MMTLIRRAKDIDSELEHWAVTLPDFWEPVTKMVFQDTAQDPSTAQFWPGPVHTYGDLSIANVWNDYRVSRIFCQAVILGCVAALPAHARTDNIERISEQAVHVTQQMVDDFCSAIPYLLGFDFKSRNQSPSEESGKSRDSLQLLPRSSPLLILLSSRQSSRSLLRRLAPLRNEEDPHNSRQAEAMATLQTISYRFNFWTQRGSSTAPGAETRPHQRPTILV